MRATLSLLCLVVFLFFAAPVQAQLRTDLGQPSPVAVYDGAESEGGGLAQRFEQLIGTVFSDDHFRMAHSYGLSMSSFGGGTSLGMYTNSMQWQFNDDWAARVDMSVAHQPFGGGLGLGNRGEGQNMRVFLRNAEVAYRPNENMEFRFQVRQSPYGRYASPSGYARPFGQRSAFAPARDQGGDLFWKDHQRN
jgi:hypothetical protein